MHGPSFAACCRRSGRGATGCHARFRVFARRESGTEQPGRESLLERTPADDTPPREAAKWKRPAQRHERGEQAIAWPRELEERRQVQVLPASEAGARRELGGLVGGDERVCKPAGSNVVETAPGAGGRSALARLRQKIVAHDEQSSGKEVS